MFKELQFGITKFVKFVIQAIRSMQPRASLAAFGKLKVLDAKGRPLAVNNGANECRRISSPWEGFRSKILTLFAGFASD